MNHSSILLILAFLLALLPSKVSADSASPIAYDIILVIVILELIFAFSVAVVCVLFSFNLILTLKDSSNEVISSLAVGDLPPSRRTLHQRDSDMNEEQLPLDYKTFRDNAERSGNTMHGNSFGSEMDLERQLPGYEPRNQNNFAAVFNSFFSYVRLW